MLRIKFSIILILLLTQLVDIHTQVSRAGMMTPEPTKDQIKELRTAIPELLQSNLENLFDQQKETSEKLKILARSIGERDQFVMTSKNLQTFLAANNLKTFTRYISSENFAKRLSSTSEKNPILLSLAKKWIRNAAIRIFADPKRSLLEVIVNACDSSVDPEKAVGKFGVGFFSILNFLLHQETDGTVITLKTNSKSGFDFENYFAYSMTFEKTGQDLQVWDDISIKFSQLKNETLYNFLRELNPSYVANDQIPTGTIITITPKNPQKMFSDKTIEALKKYVFYLSRYRWVPIYLNYDPTPINEYANWGHTSQAMSRPVNVFILPNQIKVIDRGTGINLITSLYNLIVPSSSTKPRGDLKHMQAEAKLDDVEVPHFVNPSRKHDKSQSHFLISINDVVVVDKITTDVIRNDNGEITDFQINTPQAIRQTLARDEIIISEDGKSFEESYLKNIISKTILDVLQKKLSPSYLTALYNGLFTWEQQSASKIKGRFTNYYKQVLQSQLNSNQNLVVVPSNFSDQLRQIFEFFVGPESRQYLLLPIDSTTVNYDFIRLEKILINFASLKSVQTEKNLHNLLSRAMNYQLIRGMRVLFVPDHILQKVVTLGMRTLLFVPKSELNDLTNITENIIAKCSEIDLAANSRLDCSNIRIIISTFSNKKQSKINPISQPISSNLFSKELVNKFVDRRAFGFLLRSENNKFVGLLTDKFILKLIGIENTPSYKSEAEYLNIILTATLAKFGNIQDKSSNGGIYISDSASQIDKLWPVENVTAQTLAKIFVACLWCLANNTDLGYVDKDGSFTKAKDYFMKLLHAEITYSFETTYLPKIHWAYGLEWLPIVGEEIKTMMLPFKIIGFDLVSASINNFKLENNTIPTFIEYSDTTETKLRSELQNLFKFISPAINYDQTLRFACPNFSATNAFFDIFSFKKTTAEVIKNSDSLTMISNLIETIFGFYSQYCNIPENEFPHTYGATSMITVINPVQQVDVEMLTNFLKSIESDKITLERILQFQVDDFAKQTNILLRTKELVERKIYVPKLTANTAIAMLSKFFHVLTDINNTSKLTIIRQIVESVGNMEELFFVLHILMINKNLKILKANITKQDCKLDLLLVQIKDLIQRFIHEKVDEFFISDFYKKCRDEKSSSLEYRLNLISQMPISFLVNDYLQVVLSDKDEFEYSDYPTQINQTLQNSTNFTLRMLMRAHFTGNGLKSELQTNNLKRTLKKIKKSKFPVDSWKITQAVEAGSQRSPAESTCIECLQNSVDAIKNFFKKLKTNEDKDVKRNFDLRNKIIDDLLSIKLDLHLVQSQISNNCEVLLTIQDFIGMQSLENLLADLVLPDYSKKTLAEGNVGDMGNGTFKIYQTAKAVIITTRPLSDPYKIFVLQIHPNKNLDNLVDDLNMKCSEFKPSGNWKNFWGTRFDILFEEKSKSQSIIDTVAIKDFIKNSIGATNVWVDENSPISVYFKNEKVNNISSDDIFSQYFDENKLLFKCYKRKNSFLQSYITTGGIPFRPLSPVASEMNLLPKNFISAIENGIIINLELGTYQPVQSRSHLNVSYEIVKNLKECLFEVFYLYTLEQLQNNQLGLGALFTHFSSTSGNFSQLRLNKNENQIFKDNLYTFLNNSQTQTMNKQQFFDFYSSQIANQNAKQIQKSFFDFVENEFDRGLVKQIDELTRKYQNNCDELFNDKNLADGDYEEKVQKIQKLLQTELNNLYSSWQQSISSKYYLPKTLINNVVVPWFEIKCNNVKINIKSRLKPIKTAQALHKYEKKFSPTNSNNIKDLLNSVLIAYVNCYCNLGGFDGIIPQIYLKKCQIGEFGYFKKSTNKIVISVNRPMLVTNLLKMTRDLLNKHYQDVKDNDAYNLLFGIRRGAKCGVVPHELLHVVTNTGDSYHSTNFEEQAKKQVQNVIANLFQEWSSETIKIFEASQPFAVGLVDKNISDIEQLEKNNQDALISMIFERN